MGFIWANPGAGNSAGTFLYVSVIAPGSKYSSLPHYSRIPPVSSKHNPVAMRPRLLTFSGWRDAYTVLEETSDRGLYGMAPLAFALGFTHNEEYDITAIYTGSTYCLELMLLYLLAVITSLVCVSLVLVTGYQRYENRLEDYAEYLPAFTSTILIVMGVGFILEIF
ncbi:MAG: hypothetical protein ACI8VE_001132 [Natrialbaceae archaeon]|jgi:hypothetical protein